MSKRPNTKVFESVLIEDSPAKRVKSYREYSLADVDFRKTNSEEFLLPFQCSICLEMVKKPTVIKHCMHNFCYECILRLFPQIYPTTKEESSCPQCRRSFKLEDVSPNLFHVQVIDMLTVACIHDKCCWKGTYASLKEHVKSQCEYLHYCPCDVIIQKKDIKEHEETCGKVLLPCKCGANIERSAMIDHERQVCLNSNIVCTWSKHGCIWKGLRSAFNQHHVNECKTGKLWNECEKYKKLLKGGNSPDTVQFYKKLPSMVNIGLFDVNTARRELVLKYMKTYSVIPQSDDEANPNMSFGTIADHDITVTGVKNTSIFDIDGKAVNNGCRVDLVLADRVMIVTLKGERDRWIIIPRQGTDIEVKKAFGRISITVPFDERLTVTPSVILYGCRRFNKNTDGTEAPFVIEPSIKHFTALNLKHKDKSVNDTMADAIEKLFQSTEPE